MKKIKLFVSGENAPDIKEIEIIENPQHEVVVEHFKLAFDIPDTAEPYIVHIEEDEILANGDEVIVSAEIVHQGRITCHRCEAIKTEVTYNGETKSFEFAPSATANKVVNTVYPKFGITDGDAVGLVLTLPNGIVLESAEHIGTKVEYPHCRIELALGPDMQIKG